MREREGGGGRKTNIDREAESEIYSEREAERKRESNRLGRRESLL